jgi:hypothetical protein
MSAMSQQRHWIDAIIACAHEHQDHVILACRAVAGPHHYFVRDMTGISGITLSVEGSTSEPPAALEARLNTALALLDGWSAGAPKAEARARAAPPLAWLAPLFGGEAGVLALEAYLVRSNELALMQIRDSMGDRAKRFGHALDLLVANAFALTGDLARGFVAYRSHADGYFLRFRDPTSARRSFDLMYEKQASRLRERVEWLMRHLASEPADGGDPASAWVLHARALRDEVRPLFERGTLQMGIDSLEGVPTWDERLEESRFHLAISENREFQEFMATSPGFMAARVVLNFLYVHLHRIGLQFTERIALCHLVARAIEDIHGVDAVEIVRGYMRV